MPRPWISGSGSSVGPRHSELTVSKVVMTTSHFAIRAGSFSRLGPWWTYAFSVVFSSISRLHCSARASGTTSNVPLHNFAVDREDPSAGGGRGCVRINANVWIVFPRPIYVSVFLIEIHHQRGFHRTLPFSVLCRLRIRGHAETRVLRFDVSLMSL